jgi:hypothetical protein
MAARKDRERTASGRLQAGSVRAGGLLGRAASVTARTARGAGRRALAAARGETGRRIGRAVALTMTIAVLVVTLYDRGEVPSAAARPAVRDPVAGSPPARGRPDQRRQRAAATEEPGGLRGRTRPAQDGKQLARPAEVAAAWYAASHGLPRHRVRPLQQDKLSGSEVRVLVLADPGRGRLRTALVRVRLTSSGWRVR